MINIGMTPPNLVIMKMKVSWFQLKHQMMMMMKKKPFVLEFSYDTEVDDMIYNDWSIYCIKSASSGGLVVG